MIGQLKQARAMLNGSWSGPDLEPHCLVRGPGVHLNAEYGQPDDERPLWLPTKTFHALDPRRHEVVESYSVLGALLQVGLGFDGFDLLEEVCRPPAGLQTWLRASDRGTQDVLDLFTAAIRRSKKTGARE